MERKFINMQLIQIECRSGLKHSFSKMGKFAVVKALLCFLIPAFSYGQDKTADVGGKVKLKNISFQKGRHYEQGAKGNLSDFKAIAPKSALLKNNMEGFSNTGAKYSKSQTMYSLNLTLQLKDEVMSTYKKNPSLRLGFNYASGHALTSIMYKKSKTPYDTLSSPRTGKTLFLDSITESTYHMIYASDWICFDGALLYKTRIISDMQMSLVLGVALMAGFSINTYTIISFVQKGSTEWFDLSVRFHSRNTAQKSKVAITEKIKSARNYVASIYTPIGAETRLGNKANFLSKWHLFYELRPGLMVVSIPELRAITRGFFQYGFGVFIEL